MSHSNDPEREELEDRLMDRALCEVLGGEAPPDLSYQILAAVQKRAVIAPQQKERIMDKNRRYRLLAPAAVLCLVAGVFFALLLPSVQMSREAARRSQSLNTLRQQGMPGPYYLNDSVQFQKVPMEAGASPNGRGPGQAGDRYERVTENPFRLVKDHPLSTFSIDVDTASYANARRFLLQERRLPPLDAVRIEDFVNYFDYEYAAPRGDAPFAAQLEVAACPWKEGHRLVRVALQGRVVKQEERPQCNLVFLLDVSGSMASPDKLPLLKEAMKLLARQLRPGDRVAIVVYASSEGLALPSTPGSEAQAIIDALGRLEAGGSTAGGAGIELAYRVAQENFVPGGVNRVILCTDGDFNVGMTSTAELERTVEHRRDTGVFLSVLGFGRGNLNDAMMERIANKGNGNYTYIDGLSEARKVLIEQAGGTLITIAKDVKIQVEFNPAQVAAYRLLGYENRILAAEDFNDDTKDAGEIGAGHAVTVFYEVVPADSDRVEFTVQIPSVDSLRYQTRPRTTLEAPASKELLTLKVRYKDPDADASRRLEFSVVDSGSFFGEASHDFQFAAAVAAFGMILRDSPHKGSATYDSVLGIAAASRGSDVHGYRTELLELVRRAKNLADR